MRRLVWAGLILGCGSPPVRTAVVPPAQAGTTCDLATWRTAAASTERAYLASDQPAHHVTQRPIAAGSLGTEPLVVLAIAGDDVQLATVRGDVIVSRWAPIGALGPAVVRETPVSPRPEDPADGAVRLLPGFPLSVASGAWVPVHVTGILELDGYVPASASGAIWTDVTHDDGFQPRFQTRLAIHSEPRLESSTRAFVGARAGIESRATTRAGWLEIVAHAPYVTVEGFVAPPPVPPRASTYDFPDVYLDGEIAPRLAIGTCLRDDPHGAIAGVVIGPITGELTPAAEPGWSALVIPTGWGDVTYYTDAAPIVAPAFGGSGSGHRD